MAVHLCLDILYTHCTFLAFHVRLLAFLAWTFLFRYCTDIQSIHFYLLGTIEHQISICSSPHTMRARSACSSTGRNTENEERRSTRDGKSILTDICDAFQNIVSIINRVKTPRLHHLCPKMCHRQSANYPPRLKYSNLH
jgi:hypothetical protein